MESAVLHLKPVFDACDQNGDGFVKTQDLLLLSQEHSSDGFEEMKQLIEKLDPDGHGTINFDTFCRGIQDFLGSNGGTDYDEKDSVDHLKSLENELQEDSCCERDSTYSTTSTNGYNGDDDDTFQDDPGPTAFQRNLRQYSTYPPPTDRHRLKHRAPIPLVSIESQEMFPTSDTSEYQSEEGFEGFGEHLSEDTAREHPIAESSFYGASPQRRRTSAAAAAFSRHFAFKSHSENPSRHNSLEDLSLGRPLSDSEASTSNAFLLSELQRLSSQVSLLQEDQNSQTHKQLKFRDENNLLCSRIGALEEQLENQRLSAGERVEEESRKYKSALTRLERDNEQTLDTLNRKLHKAEEEIEKMKSVEPHLRKELENSQEEKRRLLRQMDELEHSLRVKTDEAEELKSRLETEVKLFDEERHQHEQELAALTEQCESLEHFKQDAESRLKDMFKVEQHKTDLERHVQQLIKENISLKTTKEELKVQLTHNGHFASEQQGSLADELLTADKDKIISSLRDQEGENRRLRCYLDGLLMIIMEHNPTLLEVV